MIYPIIPIHKRMNSEYAWILAELRRLGLTPTGDINIDRAKVKKAKQKENEVKEEFSFEKYTYYNRKDQESSERKVMEYERTGAMNIALINRVLLQI